MTIDNTAGNSTGKKSKRKTALGKGLNALIPDIESENYSYNVKGDEFFLCDIELLKPNPFQPRIIFDEKELDSLADSIKEQGVIQPLLVRKCEVGYELVAGERRLRAAKIAGLSDVPVVVSDLTDAKLLEISIVENIQREDLNPMEEADAYHRLMTEFHMTQEETAKKVGKSRSAVANFLRLRNLPHEIRESIKAGELSMGHARAILGLEQKALQLSAWSTIIQKNLSVRETEALIRKLKTEPDPPKKEIDSNRIYFRSLEESLESHLGTKVTIKHGKEKGKLVIDYYGNDDLDQLIQRILKT